MMLDGHVYLNIDSQHIQQSSPRLLTATVEVPDDMINIWEVQVNKCVRVCVGGCQHWMQEAHTADSRLGGCIRTLHWALATVVACLVLSCPAAAAGLHRVLLCRPCVFLTPAFAGCGWPVCLSACRLAAEQADVLSELGLTDPADKLQVGPAASCTS